jgi:hypothetical protein
MELQVQKSEQKAEKLRRQSESMSQIYMDGLIKKNDDRLFELVKDPEEASELQEKRSKPKRRGNIDPHQMQLDDVDLDIQEGDLE